VTFEEGKLPDMRGKKGGAGKEEQVDKGKILL